MKHATSELLKIKTVGNLQENVYKTYKKEIPYAEWLYVIIKVTESKKAAEAHEGWQLVSAAFCAHSSDLTGIFTWQTYRMQTWLLLKINVKNLLFYNDV